MSGDSFKIYIAEVETSWVLCAHQTKTLRMFSLFFSCKF